MSVRSHIDLGLFVCVMHADSTKLPDALQHAFEGNAADPRLQKAIGTHLRAICDENLFLHECIHLWQGLTLPFVYWASFSAIQCVLRTFVHLDRIFDDYRDWKLPRAPGILGLLSERIYPHYGSKEMVLCTAGERRFSGLKRLDPFSPLTLLETAVSVTQWRLARAHGRASGGFENWVTREGGYRTMVDYLADILDDDELALELFLPLFNAAFETMNPTAAFLTGAFQYERKHRRNPRASPVGYRNRLRVVLGESATYAPNAERASQGLRTDTLNVSLIDLPTYQIDMPSVTALTFGEGQWRHPTLYRLAMRWRSLAATRPEMRNLLNDPAQAGLATLNYLLDEFNPFVIARCKFGDAERVVPVLRAGDSEYVDQVERRGSGIDGTTALRDMYTIFGLVRRASGMFYDDSIRLCGHTDCPEYKHNYCNTWMFIPPDYRDCGFVNNVAYNRDSFRRLEEADMREKRQKKQVITIDAGADSDDLAKYIARNLTDEDLKYVAVDPERREVPGVAQEPITIAVIISIKVAGELGGAAVAATAIVTVGKLIERWMDQIFLAKQTRQAITIKRHDPELSKQLLDNAEKFSEVAVSSEMRPTIKD